MYDDIVGLDDVELSGVCLPSSATTDSNETGGTPTSIISGSSPMASPSLSIPPHNHSSDSLNEDKKNVYNKVPSLVFIKVLLFVEFLLPTEYYIQKLVFHFAQLNE